jgi:hypothetical protein
MGTKSQKVTEVMTRIDGSVDESTTTTSDAVPDQPDAGARPSADLTAPPEGSPSDGQTGHETDAESASSRQARRRGRSFPRMRLPRIDAQHLEAAARLQTELGAAQWSGEIELARGLPGLLLTFERDLALVVGREGDVRAVKIAGDDIAWVNPRSRSIDIGLTGHEDIAPKGVLRVHSKDNELFTALVRISRRPPSMPTGQSQPTIRRGPQPNPLTARPQHTGTRERRVAVKRRAGHAATKQPMIARLATAFAPTAYAEHTDGVLRPCGWAGSGSPPPVGSQLFLTNGDGCWSATLGDVEHS